MKKEIQNAYFQIFLGKYCFCANFDFLITQVGQCLKVLKGMLIDNTFLGLGLAQ